MVLIFWFLGDDKISPTVVLSDKLISKELQSNFAWKRLLMVCLFLIFGAGRWQECQRPWNLFIEEAEISMQTHVLLTKVNTEQGTQW